MKGPHKRRFEEIFKSGRRVHGSLVRLASLPGTGLVGIATSKAIGSKPNRNRAKRRLREAARLKMPDRAKGLDFVLIGSQQAADAEFARIGEEIGELFGKAVDKWAEESESS